MGDETLDPAAYERPKLVASDQPVEQVTLLSNMKRWLANTALNIPTIVGPNAWDILGEHVPDDDYLNNNAADRATAEAITEMQAEVRQLQDLQALADPSKRTMFILASGASLSSYREWLPTIKERGYVIASPTVLPWLSANTQLVPDVVLVVDANWQHATQIAQSGVHRSPDAVVCMTPEASPVIPTLFGRDKTFWFRTCIPGPDGSLDWEPYAVFQGLLLSIVRVRLAQLGCVTNMGVTLALALQEYAGWDFDQIVLLGADYGYWNNFNRISKDGSAELERYDKESPSLIKWDGLWTDRRMVRYKASLLVVWMQAQAKIYSMSHGILKEFPRVTKKQVERGAWPEYPSYEEMRDRVVKWLQHFQQSELVYKGEKESE